ncbi:MAG: uracil-xanthine permease [Oscillospiraceae bacterium]|nr:uracil-xanthine permease [Oscillospiraceae bacterium]
MKFKQALWGGDKPGRAVTLGIQHVFAMFGSTVLVPALTGLDPAVTLLSMGIGTLIFHLVTRGMVPAFMGSSFSFIASISAVGAYCTDHSIGNFASYVGWGIIASGVLYLILSLLVKLFGAKRITGFFPPIVTGCMIIIIGMMLAPTAMGNITTAIGDIPMWKNWVVAITTITVIILVMFFTRGFIKLVPILIGIIAGYLLALALGMVDTTSVVEAKWFALPQVSLPAITNWDAVIFSVTLIAPISVVTFVEHVGDITANGAVTGHNYIEEPGLHRTLLGCGLASIFSGGMGGPAATTYSENTGVLAATRNYNPATLRIAAVFAIVLALFGKVSGVLSSIPAPVMGGVSVILFGMIASVGLRMLVENKVDFTKSYNLVIAAVMLVIGLGLSGGIDIGNINISGTAIAAVLGVILSKLLPKEESEDRKKKPHPVSKKKKK